MAVSKPSDLDRKNISLHLDTYGRMSSYGVMNESFTDLADTIMDFAEAHGMTPETLKKFRDSAHKNTP
jgi:hypothetical protein